MVSQVVNTILFFFLFSFIGWCMEVTLKYIQFHRFINRGFFTGPILPIYGGGVVLINLSVGGIARYESGYLATFIISFVVCGLVEYFTSYFLEKRYHARWWDYSQKPMNLNGRVWIGNLVLFGLAGVLIIHVVDPVFFSLMDKISLLTREIIAGILTVLFGCDYVITHFVMKLVKVSVESSDADNTEAISGEIKTLFSDKNYFYQRFADAYPEVIYKTEKIDARIKAIKEETERMRREAEERFDERVSAMNERFEKGKKQMATTFEPTASIKSTLIRQQAELIQALYDESTASEESRKLIQEIERNRDRLKKRGMTV